MYTLYPLNVVTSGSEAVLNLQRQRQTEKTMSEEKKPDPASRQDARGQEDEFGN